MIGKHFGRDSRTRIRRYALTMAAAMFLIAIGVGGASSRTIAADVGGAVGAVEAGSFTAIGTPRSFAKAPGVHGWTYTMAREAPPASPTSRLSQTSQAAPTSQVQPFDRIGLHRITRGAHPPAHPKLVVLYLPGTNMNGEVAVDDPRYSLPLFMAAHGIDFWALDYRTHFIAPATPVADLAELKGWTNELFESDIEAAVS